MPAIRSDGDSSRSLSPLELRLLAFAPVVFCGVFLAVLIRNYQQVEAEIVAAREWVETPCVIAVATKHAGYRSQPPYLSVRYRYEFRGTAYQGDIYRLGHTPTLLHDDADWFVREHPPKSQTVCYVNPHDPGQAVLNRSDYENPTWGIALFGAAGGLWALVGIGMWRAAGRAAAEARSKPA